MTQEVNQEAPDFAPSEVQTQEVAPVTMTTESAPIAHEADDNMFNAVKDQSQPDNVPLKVFQETKAKSQHKIRQAQQEVEKLRQERDYVIQQLQQVANNGQVAQPQQAQNYTPDQIVAHIDREATRKATEAKIVELVSPAASKYDDFVEVTEDLPWSAGMIMATKDMPDSGEFIYHLSKLSPDAVRKIANASTAEERGVMLAEYKNKWKSRNSNTSADRKIVSKADSPPTQTPSGSPGLGKVANNSYQAALMRTGRLVKK